MAHGWISTQPVDGVNHVIPTDDLRDHAEAQGCWCRHTIEDGMMVHHSMDGREAFELGERLPS